METHTFEEMKANLGNSFIILSASDLKSLLLNENGNKPAESDAPQDAPPSPESNDISDGEPITFINWNGQQLKPCKKGEERLYTARQISEILGITMPTIKHWVQEGSLIRFRFGNSNRIYFREHDILSMFKKVKAPKPKELIMPAIEDIK